jgi:ribosomal protein S7
MSRYIPSNHGTIVENNKIQKFEQAISKTLSQRLKCKTFMGAFFVIQVPLVDPERGTVLAMQWLLTAARNRSGRSSVSKLTNEVMDAE